VEPDTCVAMRPGHAWGVRRRTRIRRSAVIGLLDPALFLPRSDPEVERDLDRVIRTCREHAIQLVLGRNFASHAAADCTLDEITRWVLHVQPKGIGHRQILCVHHPRNLRERWTARFDWRLPSSSDGARYPFCPPAHWWKGKTPAHR